MLQIEQTIITATRDALQRLRAPVSTAEDLDDALAAFQGLTALVMLAHIKDSGLSKGAVDELLAIEKEAVQALQNVSGGKSSGEVKKTTTIKEIGQSVPRGTSQTYSIED